MVFKFRKIIYYFFLLLIIILSILSLFSFMYNSIKFDNTDTNNKANLGTKKNDNYDKGKRENKKNYDYKEDLNYDKDGFSPIWPIDPYPGSTSYRGISAYYIDSEYKKMFGVNHYAIDIRAVNRTIILAVEDGQVIKVGEKRAQGWEIVLKHEQGYSSLYGHLAKISVEVGAFVKQGQFIGLTGAGKRGGGISTGPHLHFEIRKNNRRLDPLLFLDLTILPQSEIRRDYWKRRNKQIREKSEK